MTRSGPHTGPLTPSPAELDRLRRVAQGEAEADLAVRGGTVAVVHTGQSLPRDVLIVGRFIAAVTPHGLLAARRTLDAGGLHVLPGYLDVRMRLEHTLLTAGELARLVVPRGTTTVVAEPSGVTAGLGPAGADLLSATRTPLRVLARAAGRRFGHPPDGGGGATRADRLPAPFARTVAELAADGHVDHDVRAAVAAGTSPPDAVRMATLVRARSARLEHVLGSVTPSRLADLQLVDRPAAAAPPELVLTSGRIAAERGRPLFDNHDVAPDWVRDTVRLAPGLCSRSFAVPAPGPRAWVQAAELVTGGGPAPALYLTRAFHADLPVVDGCVAADPSRDVLKIAIVDRHRGAEAVGLGFVRGFGLERGALAATTNDENGNVVVVGASDEDMLTAVRALEGMGGGFSAVARGWVRAACPLSVAGIVSDATWETVLDQLAGVNAAAADLGCPLPAPFLALANAGRTDVGDLGLTERGLVDVAAGSPAPVVLPVVGGRPTCRCPSHTFEVHRLFGAS